jgi:hypothetical protein
MTAKMKRVLMLGAGTRRQFLPVPPTRDDFWMSTREDETDWQLTCVDNNPAHADTHVLHDLNNMPWPMKDDLYDEAHAYEILEHLGRQGDARAFFDCFYEIWRVLKPGGWLVGTCPRFDSQWAWGDPSHTRVITPGSLLFLDQTEYDQVGKTPMSDFRGMWRGDFKTVKLIMDNNTMGFWLQAVKPAKSV